MATKRKWSSLVLSAVLLSSLLAACSSNSKNGASSSSAAPSESSSASASPSEEKLKPLTLSYYSEDVNPNWANMQDDIGKFLTEKTGITIDAEFAVGDAVQKSALIASSGDFPDIIMPKTSINKFVDAGAVLDLTDLINEHAPNIKKVFEGQMNRLKYSEADQAIYVIPSYDGINQQNLDTNGGFQLQHRVVKELGYPTIRTVKDFENAIKGYLEKHPKDENGNPNIGLSLIADDWRMYIGVTNPAFAVTGGSDDGEYYVDINTNEVTYHFRRPEEKEYFRWLNHMNAEGLLDKESFVQKYDQYKAKIATGRVLGLIDQKWDFDDGQKALKSEGKFDQAYGHYPVTMSEEYKHTAFWPTGFTGGSGIAISVDNPDPVRTIKFLDYLASDEGQVLVNWGIEGKHYKVENGKRVIPADVNDRKINDAINFQKEAGIGSYNLLSAKYGDGVVDPSGNYYTTNFPEQIMVGYSDVEKEVLAAYNGKTWKDLFPNETEFKVKPWGALWNIPVPSDSELVVLEEKIKNITWKRVPEAILAKPDQFDAIWDKFLKEIEAANVKKAEGLRQELLNQRLVLWGN
ncbi:ABC transporter substrate-binding protein [Cohnella sp. WQ 127256]|uniref:ABC transporter substrate-binding protein n=1 Tax=Cohnella sp. WQ 127256 TaxID=2938790 RepID=UPI002117D1E2|nr:ABC transporter substrate-binding protein [Cohnella sp. WQ 127256]